MDDQELNFNEEGLAGLKEELENHKAELSGVLKAMRGTDGALAETLCGGTQQEYRKRADAVSREFQSSIEAVDALIRQVEQVNQVSAETDREIGRNMIL